MTTAQGTKGTPPAAATVPEVETSSIFSLKDEPEEREGSKMLGLLSGFIFGG
jgi:hypothetical protein